ncbi:MAG: GFA family protein [Gammaproteobacteria bacterium]|nr:MAG: GFA family protein [Gammaproteobacteria bacterium]
MNEQKVSGSCLCGEVTYQYTGRSKVFQYCHCTRCRKFTGSAYAANIIVDPSRFRWLSGEDCVGRFELPGARHFATSFCRNCGSSLPWLTQSGTAVVIPAGTLDSDPNEKPVHNIFMANKAPWFEEVDNLKKYEQLPVKEREEDS